MSKTKAAPKSVATGITTTYISGASDDLIEVDSTAKKIGRDEFGSYDRNRCLIFSDGTVVSCVYDGQWKFKAVRFGALAKFELMRESADDDCENPPATPEECKRLDAPVHSQIVKVTGAISSVRIVDEFNPDECATIAEAVKGGGFMVGGDGEGIVITRDMKTVWSGKTQDAINEAFIALGAISSEVEID